MKRIIIIRGPLGIGKTTLSKLVAKKLNGVYYSIDDILSQNKLDTIDKTIGCISESNFIKANNLLLNLLKKDLDDKNYIIIDGNFYQEGALKDLLKKLKEFNVIVFTLKASLNLCIQRDSNRKDSYGKDATTAVYNLVSKFDYGYIINNEGSNIEEKVNEIISKVIQK